MYRFKLFANTYNLIIFIILSIVQAKNQMMSKTEMQELDTYRRSRGWALFVYSSLLIAVVYVCACPIVANINQKVKDKKTADKEAEMNAQIALLKRQIAAQEEKITAQQAEIERLNKGSNA